MVASLPGVWSGMRFPGGHGAGGPESDVGSWLAGRGRAPFLRLCGEPGCPGRSPGTRPRAMIMVSTARFEGGWRSRHEETVLVRQSQALENRRVTVRPARVGRRAPVRKLLHRGQLAEP